MAVPGGQRRRRWRRAGLGRSIISIRDKAGQYEEAALAAEQAMVHAEKAGDERLVLRGIALFASMLASGPTRPKWRSNVPNASPPAPRAIGARRRSSPGAWRRCMRCGARSIVPASSIDRSATS